MRKIGLTRGLVALVDDDDYERVSSCNWQANPSYSKSGRFLGYYAVARDADGRTIYMHREILGVQPGQLVDHADKDGLNNTRANLRPCTQSLNNANAAMKVARSGYRGVYPSTRGQRWRARIQVDGKFWSLGSFATPADAGRAYDEAALKAFGVFATLNFPARRAA